MERDEIDRQELSERFRFRPMCNVAFFTAGILLGMGVASVDTGLMVVGAFMFALYYFVTELYWRVAYRSRVEMKHQISRLREHVQQSYAWSDRWRSIAMGHGDPWKGRERADA